MGPEIAAIAFAAAAVGVGAASSLTSMVGNKSQLDLDLSTIELRRDTAKMQAAELANQNAQGFRRALASQVALASFRGGSGSVARQFSSNSFSSFFQDQEAIKRGARFADLRAKNEIADAYGRRTTGDIKSIIQGGATALSIIGPALGGA